MALGYYEGATETALPEFCRTPSASLVVLLRPSCFSLRGRYNTYKKSFSIPLAGVIAAIGSNIACWWWTKEEQKKDKRTHYYPSS